MHKILRYHGTKGSILSAERATIDDKLDVLLDANDVILERTVGEYLCNTRICYCGLSGCFHG